MTDQSSDRYSRPDTPLSGLTEAEAAALRQAGLGNQVPSQSTRAYKQIVRENLFTFINIVLFGLGFVLILLGRTSDALVSVGVILVNVIVNVIQEIRAKRILDRIALITRPTATLVRDGQRRKVDPAEIVRGDILVVEPGDQIVVDGRVVGEGHMETDESLLTGESNPASKQNGAPVYSGSFCLTGSGLYQAEKVGIESFSAQVTATARVFRRTLTPLQKQINLVVRILLLVAVYFELIHLVGALMERLPFVQFVRMSVVILGLVPNGLFLAIATAYTLGAVRIARKGALVQQANAIESLSNVNLICLDKTGTLTTSRMFVHGMHPYQISDEQFRTELGDYTASLTVRNATAAAIFTGTHGKQRPIIEEVPFSSEYKWSGLALDGLDAPGVFVLGAPEILAPAMAEGIDLAALSAEDANRGYRVVAFAYHPALVSMRDAAGKACLPQDLSLLGWVSLENELRPGTSQTLKAFRKAGVELKIISGDSPDTVAALAEQAGFEDHQGTVSGLDLAQMDAAEQAQAIAEHAIFGRITPQQKEQMVRTLRDQGHYVAMIGDGVNDVLALKQANVAIALQGGSQAARSVSDLILLNDSFIVLPEVLLEGQRILTGMQDILKLFLTRIIYVALLMLSTGFVGSFPLSPKNSSIMVLLTVGLPSLAVALWAKPGLVSHRGLTRSLFRFVVPASLSLSLGGLLVFIVYLIIPSILMGQSITAGGAEINVSPTDQMMAQTALVTYSIFCGLLLLLFIEPPSKFWVGGQILSTDRRPTYLACFLCAAYLAILLSPGIRHFFDMTALNFFDLVFLGGMAALWALFLRWIWRSRVFDRFLSLDFGGE